MACWEIPVRVSALLFASLHGSVHAADDHYPAVAVRVDLDGTPATFTDSAGAYCISGLRHGGHLLRFSASGFESRELTVFLSDTTDLQLDVLLARKPIILPGIDVVALRRADSITEPGLFRVGAGWQAAAPAGAVDIQQELIRRGGVAARGDNATSLSIHGGQGSENEMLVDGIPLYGAVHFAGASSAINPDAIGGIDLHTGVSPARFDGALSGVIDLATAKPTDAFSGALSTVDARLTAGVALGKNTQGLVSVRSSFRDLLTDATSFGVGNRYDDYLVATTTQLGKGVLHALGFWSGNQIRWERSPLESLSDGDTTAPDDNTIGWRSSAAGLTWRTPIANGNRLRAAVWWSGSGANAIIATPDQSGIVNGRLDEFGLSSEWSGALAHGELSAGAQLSLPVNRYQSTAFDSSTGLSSSFSRSETPLVASTWIDWRGSLLPKLEAQLGLRSTVVSAATFALDPRLTLSYRTDRRGHIDLAVGRTRQLLQSLLNDANLLSFVASPGIYAISSNMRPASSDQLVVELGRVLTTGLSLELSGYLRSWNGVLLPSTTTTGLFALAMPPLGSGTARGAAAALTAHHRGIDVLFRVGSDQSTQHAGKFSVPSGYAERWVAALLGRYQFATRTSFRISWNGGSGQLATPVVPGIEWVPYQPATGHGEIDGAPVDSPGPLNGFRLAARSRLDLGLQHEWSVGGSQRTGTLTTSLSLQNVFNRSNPIGMMLSAGGGLEPLGGTPRGLVIEVSWRH